MPTEILRPNAVGTATALTPVGASTNWQCVDEASSDEDSTYVDAPGAVADFLQDNYALQNTVIPADSYINSVSTNARARGTTIDSTGQLQLGYVQGGSSSGSGITITTSYADYVGSNPVTFADTVAELNSLQIRVGLRNNAGAGSRCTQAWVAVDHDDLPEFEQEGFRWRDDDDNEADATWLDTQDTDITRAIETPTRLRILTDTSVGDTATASLKLQVRKVGDTVWSDILPE